MKKLWLIASILFCFSITFSQRVNPTPDELKRSEPKIYFKKNNKEITEKRSPKSTFKLVNPNDNAKTIDFSVENIGKTEGLVVVSESLDKKYNNWKVVVKNKGIVKSDNSVYAVLITKYVSEKLNTASPFPSKPVTTIVFQEYKILPKLNPNEEMTLWFNFDKSGMPKGDKSPFGDMFSGLSKTNVSYKIDTYFVTEPIVFK